MSYARKKRPILLEEQELSQRKETTVGAPEELILQREKGTKIQQLLVELIGCLAAVATFKLYEWNTDKIVSAIEEKQGVLSSVGYWGANYLKWIIKKK